MYQKLSTLLNKIKPEVKSSRLFEEIEKILEKLNEGVNVQESSTTLMKFLIQDLLDYAQIKSGKFRQNIVDFNIREAVEKVMCIQR